jgi:hypothetical protein
VKNTLQSSKFMNSNDHLRIVLLILIGLIVPTYFGFAQVGTYTFSQSIGAYNEIPTGEGSIAYAAPWDNHVTGNTYEAVMPFLFTYDGNTYSSCFISPNGFITFGTIQPVANLYAPLSNGALYSGAVSALGIDLSSNGDDITYATLGSSPNRVFVVQYKNVIRKGVDLGDFNFQIHLYESSNKIEFSYGQCSPEGTTARNAQVGLRGETNVFAQKDVNNRLFTLAAAENTWFLGSGVGTGSGTANASAMKTNAAVYPDNGLTYSWTPANSCVFPTGSPSNLIVGGTSITHNSFTGNTFTPALPSPSNYLVVRSTQSTPPNNAQILDGTYYIAGNIIDGIYNVVVVLDGSVNNFTQTGLVQDTQYYYWVIPYNGNCLGGPLYSLANKITASATTCFPIAVILPSTDIEGNSFTMNWNELAGAPSYVIQVSTNSAFTAFVPGYENLNVGNVTSFTVTGLVPKTKYYYRVRAVGNSDCLRYNTTSGGNVDTVCGYYTVPYAQNFDVGITLPNLPNCFERVDDNTDGIQWTTNNSNSASSPNAMRLNKSTTSNSNDWFFLPGLQLVSGETYRLQFRYNTVSNNQFVENLRVRLGSGQTPASMNITILDLPNLTNVIYQTAIIDFSVVTDGVYYLGFQGYSFANQSNLFVDDISVVLAPSCFEPTNITVSGITSNAVTISWDPSNPEPSNGYQYYISTSNVSPTSATIPSGIVGAGIETITISTGLNASTTYYVWVRGNCGTSKSEWSLLQVFSTDCIAPQVMTSSGVTRCGLGTATISATPNIGATIEWYALATGGAPLVTGNSYITPVLEETTTFYAQAYVNGGAVSLGRINPTFASAAITKETAVSYVNFTVTSRTTLQSVDIYSVSSGQSGVVVLKNSANQVVGSYPFTTLGVAGTTAQAITINAYLQPGNYTLHMEAVPTAGLIVNPADAAYPYTSSVAEITGNGYDNSMYLYFYNWRFTTECLSARTPVTVTIAAPPTLSFSEATLSICEGLTTSLVSVSGIGSFNTFTITPSQGVTGNPTSGYVFNPSATTTYTLTGTQTTGAKCATTTTITINVDPAPPTIVVNPSNATVCEDEVIALTTSLGTTSQTVVYTENFEGVTSWTATQTTTGATPTVAANTNWILRQSPYNYASPYWVQTFASNDNSKFFMAFADAGGSGSRTKAVLESPLIDLSGYNNATLTFWHYLRRNAADVAAVQVSIDGGSTWSNAASYTLGHSPDKANGFVQSSVSLLAYVGYVVKIRFNYDSIWNYGWAVDNISISASLALDVVWSPATNLYTDAGATIPYDAAVATDIVYAKLVEDIVYTARVAGFNGCFATATTAITVQAKPDGGSISPPQNICSSSHSLQDIVVSDSQGNVVRWEYANDAGFTSGVGVINHYTTTLPVSQFGSFTAVRYFRAVFGNGVCALVRSPHTYVSYTQTTWNGSVWSNGSPSIDKKVVFNGNYTSSGNIEACSIEVISGVVNVLSGHTFLVENEVKVTGGQFVFENDASLVQIQNAVNTGAIIYKRNSEPMVKYDFTYWSSPVTPQTVGAFSPNTRFDKYFKWDTAAYTWQVVPSTALMTKGLGYIMRAPDVAPFNPTTANVFLGQFNGVPTNGIVTFPIVVNGINDLNFIGNPYPSAIHADNLFEAVGNDVVLGGAIYLWTHNTPITNLVYANDDFAIYNALGGVGTRAVNPGLNTTIPDGTIASGQGFFINGLVSGTGYFDNTMRLIGSNGNFYRQASAAQRAIPSEKHRIWLEVKNTAGAYKQTMLGYTTRASNDFDVKYDAEILNADNVISFYSVLGSKELCIQGRSFPFEVSDQVPLGFESQIAGEFTISITQMDGLFEQGQRVYLEDTYVNSVYDLTEGDYSFTTTIGVFKDRFVLRYTEATLGVNQPDFTRDLVVYKEQHSLVVKVIGTVLEQVSVFDVRGRQLISKASIHSDEVVFETIPDTNQVLLVQVITQDGRVTTKKMVY